MLLVKILLIILFGCFILYWVIPAGNILHEFFHLPVWIFRLSRQPYGKYVESCHRYGKHRHQYLLFFNHFSEPSIKRKNVVVYIHGGGWQFGKPEMFRANAQTLISEGFPVFILTHRRLTFYHISHMRQDLASGMEHILQLKNEHGYADYGIILGGMSSGGHLASLTYFDPRILMEKNLKPEIIKGLFLLGSPLNFGAMWQSPPLFLLAGKRNGVRYGLANPMAHIQTNLTAPILIVHGEKDGLIPYDSVRAFYSKLKTVYAGRIEFHCIEEGIHTDSASLGFAGHPSQNIILDWLEKVDSGKLAPEADLKI